MTTSTTAVQVNHYRTGTMVSLVQRIDRLIPHLLNPLSRFHCYVIFENSQVMSLQMLQSAPFA
jgi:hypothetical protein